MDSETRPASDPDNIPAYWPLNYAFSAKDALAWASMLAFMLAPMLLDLREVSAWFGLVDRVPVGDQLYGMREWQWMAACAIVGIAGGVAGKYLWLVAMCRVLTRSNVGPIIAYGQPRRIARFDRAIVVRFYKTDGPALEPRLLPPKPKGYMVRLHVAAYAGGALLSLGIGFLPLMRSDPRPWHLATFFAVPALFFFVLGCWVKSKKP